MAYKQRDLFSALRIAGASWFRPSYLGLLARTTLDWGLAHSRYPIHDVSLERLTSSIPEVTITFGSHAYGDTPAVDLLALCVLIRRTQPTTVFEFGTYTGHTTINMLLNGPSHMHVTTLDLPPEMRKNLAGLDWESDIDDSKIGLYFYDDVYCKRITQILENSLSFDATPYRQRMDLVFVDACHEYEFVNNDTIKAFEMLSPRGLVVWHDYSRACPGVTRCVGEVAQQRRVYTVAGTQIAFCPAPGIDPFIDLLER